MRKGKLLLYGAILAFLAAFLLLNIGRGDAVERGEAVVLYTNDVHCAIDGYSNLAAYRRQMIDAGFDTLTVDAGDNAQGGMIGALTDGLAPVELMNLVPYDIAVPGNHEFDYGMDGFFKLLKNMKYTALSLNFEDVKAGSAVLPAYKIVELGGHRVAVVGLCTPETYTKSSPKYFEDGDGNLAYSFGEDAFYQKIQAAVDSARGEGAELVILVCHLGVNGVVPEWSAASVIANTRGIDAVIDGHSHEAVAGERYANADGWEVVYTQTGTRFMFIGKMTIAADGTIRTELIHPSDIRPDATESSKKAYDEVQAVIDEDNRRMAYLTEKLGVSEVALATHDPETGLRRVRSGECSMGDFVADAYRAVLGSQIGLVNGGGVRASIEPGDVTRLDLMNINPWNNRMCVVEWSGQKLLDMLEFQSRYLPDGECGGFFQVSGMSYEIDASVPSPAKVTDRGVYDGIEEGKPRRVRNVLVGGQPLDLAAAYQVACSEYILLESGDGMGSSEGVKIIKRGGLPTDAECLVQYFTQNLGGKVTAEDYPNPVSDERIRVLR